MSEPATVKGPIQKTALYGLHKALGARMVPFAGYEMPVQYPQGIIAEHTHTRKSASLFDVSHMGQAFLEGPDHQTTARALENLVPGEILGLKPGRIRYTQLTNSNGGIIDDLMVTRSSDPEDEGRLYLVVNASRKALDYEWLEQHLPSGIVLRRLDDRSLIALQGPKAELVMSRHCPQGGPLRFMAAAAANFDGHACHVSRSGYTGEDGFEISIPSEHVEAVARSLLSDPEVRPAGLGARDSLRLEAGFCLYGHDIDDTTSPVEADLAWSISRRRREEGGFTGARRIKRELAEGTPRLRVGLRPEGRVPAREGTVIRSKEGPSIGKITSGGFGPTVGEPVAMGYVETGFAVPGTPLDLVVRDRVLAATVVALPFVPHSYKH